MANWVVKDIITGASWDFIIDNGLFGITRSNSPVTRDPIIKDSILKNTYWHLFIADGEVGWNSVVSTSSDSVYMYDNSLKNWFVIQISEGIFDWTLSSGPGGSHGLYPLDYYYKYVLNTHNVRYLIKVYGSKEYSKENYIKFKSKKDIKQKLSFTGNAQKQLSKEELIKLNSKKQYSLSQSIDVNSTKQFVREFNVTATSKKEIELCESVKVKGKKDILNVLAALDLV